MALEKYGAGGPALMIGDSTWDVKAATAAGVPTLALLTGGFSEAELREVGRGRGLALDRHPARARRRVRSSPSRRVPGGHD